ncbi:MAG: NAD-dependent epimerase/dehydratase family protein [Bacteroidota bacterium]
MRDYIHIDDLASAHRLAIEATTPETAEVFNIGTGQVLNTVWLSKRSSLSKRPVAIQPLG